MGRTLRAAVVGAGHIATHHLDFLQKSDKAELCGVCDLSPALANFSRGRFEADAAYIDLSQMLQEKKPDVVHVLTPPHTHFALMRTVLENDAHVVCEKPATYSAEELDTLLELARQSGKKVIEDHNYRFNANFLALERLVSNGGIGRPTEVEVRFDLSLEGSPFMDGNFPHYIHQAPAGVVHDFLPHLLYLILRFMPEVDEVNPLWRKINPSDWVKYDDFDALLTGGGMRGRARFSAHTAPDAFTCTVRGEEGMLTMDFFQPYLQHYKARCGGGKLSGMANQWHNGCVLARAGLGNFRQKLMGYSPYEGLYTFLDKTYEALLSDEDPPVSEEDMRKVVGLVDRLVSQEEVKCRF